MGSKQRKPKEDVFNNPFEQYAYDVNGNFLLQPERGDGKEWSSKTPKNTPFILFWEKKEDKNEWFNQSHYPNFSEMIDEKTLKSPVQKSL